MKLDGHITFPEEESLNYINFVQLSLYIRERKHLLDCYIPLKIHWINDRKAKFSTEVLLNQLINNKSLIKSSIWDFYISCSAKNDHCFVRLAGNKEKEISAIYKIVTPKHYPIVPYYTEYGNFSLNVGLHKYKNKPNPLAQKVVRKIKALIHLGGK